MLGWKYAKSGVPGFGSIFGQIPTEFGLARISVARHVPVALASRIEQVPAVEGLLRKVAKGRTACRKPCECWSCEAIRILMVIDGTKEPEPDA